MLSKSFAWKSPLEYKNMQDQLYKLIDIGEALNPIWS